MNIIINDKKVAASSIVMEDVDMRDYPDFCDAYVVEAAFEDGTPLNEAELQTLTEEHGNELAHESIC